MRVIVCGSRSWIDEGAIMNALKEFPPSAVVIHGTAEGADRIAGQCAKLLGLTIEEYPALWGTYGRRAGHVRNRQMLDTGADLVLAFMVGRFEDGGFGGPPSTSNMIGIAQAAGIETRVQWDDRRISS